MSVDRPAIQEQPASAPPRTLLVSYGQMRLVGRFPCDFEPWPVCGSKVVIRTRRGTELAEVLATACSDCSCSKRVSPEQIDTYIQKSGGDDYPYSTDGRVLCLATPDDLQQQSRLQAEKLRYLAACEQLIAELELPMKLVDVDLVLGGEMTTFYFLSENRVDFRSLVKRLAAQFHTRIQMHQVGARDEARLVADYETCGQHCCCRQFLKILRPVSMGAAKMQKATLDPTKISGRCGRLKCCLRYEEATYDELRRKLPRVGHRVRTAEGVGVVEETMILTQLVKVHLEDDRIVAVRVDELLDRESPDTSVQCPCQQVADSQLQAEPRPPRPESRRDRSRPPKPRTEEKPQPKPQVEPRPQDQSSPPPVEQIPDSNEQDHTPILPPASQPSSQGPSPAPSSPAAQLPEDDTPRPGIGMLGRRRRRGRGRGPQSPPSA